MIWRFAPISPLLANVALHVLDQAWAKSGWRYGVLVRYADDYVVVCRSQRQAEEARRRASQVLAPWGFS